MMPCFPCITETRSTGGLVSQAILNGMTIVTPDEAIARYPAPVLW